MARRRQRTERQGGVIAFALAGIFLVASCRPAVSPVPDGTVSPQAASLLEKLAAERKQIRSLRSFARIGYKLPANRSLVTGRHTVVVEWPDQFRLEAYSPIGLLAVAACDGHSLDIYDRRNNTVYRGVATAGLIGSYLSIPLTPRDIVAVLLGRLPEREFLEEGIVDFDAVRSQFRLYRSGPQGASETVWFDPRRLRVTAAEIVESDGSRLKVRLRDYGLTGGVMLPHRIELESMPGGGGLRIVYRAPAVNDDLPHGLFEIPTRPGLKELLFEQGRSGL